MYLNFVHGQPYLTENIPTHTFEGSRPREFEVAITKLLNSSLNNVYYFRIDSREYRKGETQ